MSILPSTSSRTAVRRSGNLIGMMPIPTKSWATRPMTEYSCREASSAITASRGNIPRARRGGSTWLARASFFGSTSRSSPTSTFSEIAAHSPTFRKSNRPTRPPRWSNFTRSAGSHTAARSTTSSSILIPTSAGLAVATPMLRRGSRSRSKTPTVFAGNRSTSMRGSPRWASSRDGRPAAWPKPRGA